MGPSVMTVMTMVFCLSCCVISTSATSNFQHFKKTWYWTLVRLPGQSTVRLFCQSTVRLFCQIEEPMPKSSAGATRRTTGTRTGRHEKSHYFGPCFLAYYSSGAVPTWRAVCSEHPGCTKSMRINQEPTEDSNMLFD